MLRRFASALLRRENTRLRADRDTWKRQAEHWQRRHRADTDRLGLELRHLRKALADEQARHHNTETNLGRIADEKWNRDRLHIQRLEDQAAKDRATIEQLDRELREANTTIGGLGLEIKNYERAIDRAETNAATGGQS